MNIVKDDKVYNVKENKVTWTVSRKIDNLEIAYNVPKEVCPTFEKLNDYVMNNNLF